VCVAMVRGLTSKGFPFMCVFQSLEIRARVDDPLSGRFVRPSRCPAGPQIWRRELAAAEEEASGTVERSPACVHRLGLASSHWPKEAMSRCQTSTMSDEACRDTRDHGPPCWPPTRVRAPGRCARWRGPRAHLKGWCRGLHRRRVDASFTLERGDRRRGMPPPGSADTSMPDRRATQIGADARAMITTSGDDVRAFLKVSVACLSKKKKKSTLLRSWSGRPRSVVTPWFRQRGYDGRAGLVPTMRRQGCAGYLDDCGGRRRAE